MSSLHLFWYYFLIFIIIIILNETVRGGDRFRRDFRRVEQ